MKERIIFHVDVNNAFLSWTATEMLKQGSKVDIRNRYAIIGGDETQRRGIVLAKSNLCKKKGVTTAEAIYQARRKCPYLELYKPDYTVYKKYSDMLYNYLSKYSPIIERYSIDECFIDYSDCQKLFGDSIKLAYKIKDDIYHNLGFTVNVGIGNNKLCAKMASDFTKPNKVHTLFLNEVEENLWPLPINDLFMIGHQTTKKLLDLNIKTVYDLAHADLTILVKHFKNMGKMMLDFANGIDNSEVYYLEENPKSISHSTVLSYNYTNKNDIYYEIKKLSINTGKKLRGKKLYATTVTIWIKYSNFMRVNKQIKLKNCINTDEDIYKYAIELFNKTWNNEPVRGLCVGVLDFNKDNIIQLDLFNQQKQYKKKNKLQETIDEIKYKYGDNLITYADMIKERRNKNE